MVATCRRTNKPQQNPKNPHNHQIGALAVALREAATPEFKEYIRAVKANARALSAALLRRGYTICTGGTDNHLVLWDLRPQKLTGSKMEKLCEAAHISLNKNAIHGDRSAAVPGGVRLGTPAMTTRGLDEAAFETVAEFLDEAVQIALRIQERTGPKLAAFAEGMDGDGEVEALRERVRDFSTEFYMP